MRDLLFLPHRIPYPPNKGDKIRAYHVLRYLQRHFRVSPPAVHQMVLALERAGLIRRRPGLARSIEVLVKSERLPVLRPAQPVKTSVQRD